MVYLKLSRRSAILISYSYGTGGLYSNVSILQYFLVISGLSALHFPYAFMSGMHDDKFCMIIYTVCVTKSVHSLNGILIKFSYPFTLGDLRLMETMQLKLTVIKWDYMHIWFEGNFINSQNQMNFLNWVHDLN